MEHQLKSISKSGIPEAIAKVEADEKKIISTCQAPGFTTDKLKELYKQIRPGTY